MNILEKIKELHKIHPKVDLNSILTKAANKMGYVEYSMSMSDMDLLSGLKKLTNEDFEPGKHPVCHSYYEGQLI